MTTCSEYDRLDFIAEDVLGDLAQLAILELDRFQARDYSSCRVLDKAVDSTVGKKERALGALRQHMMEHKCQSRKPM